ncbi:MAG: N-acetylglucosamine-specific PTS transporter subunit IIBC [Acholeplasmataceae bacterium]
MKSVINAIFEYLQRIGKSLMLPVSILPAAAILMGIGYWINPSFGTQNNAVAHFLFESGGAIINNMSLLFAAGIAYGLSKDKDGIAAISGVISFLVITSILSINSVAMIQNIDTASVNIAFEHINNQFIGIISGILGGHIYNRFSKTELPKPLAFFSGKRLVPILSSFCAMFLAAIFFFLWPFFYNVLVSFGVMLGNLDIVGVGLFGFFSRLLIPFGLHHALNSVFWFDGFGISDLQNFFSNNLGTVGITGRYMAGFFPIMMFGLPGAALAIIHTSKKEHRVKITSIMVAAAFTSFFTGITEPIEFSFLFVAPILLIIHALFTGLSMMIAAAIPALSGFGFSAGFIDLILSARNQYAVNAWMLPILGIGFGLLYYVVFRFLILKLNLQTPGRGVTQDMPVSINETSYLDIARHMLEALGGSQNIVELDHCATRLRLRIKDTSLIDDEHLKRFGALSVLKTPDSAQVVIGTTVQFIASDMRLLMQQK